MGKKADKTASRSEFELLYLDEAIEPIFDSWSDPDDLAHFSGKDIVVKASPDDVIGRYYESRKDAIIAFQNEINDHMLESLSVIQASVLSVSACTDDELAEDTNNGSTFTKTFHYAIAKLDSEATLKEVFEFVEEMLINRSNPTHPQWNAVGTEDTRFSNHPALMP